MKISDDDLLKLHKEGLLHKEIAKIAECSTCTITSRLLRLGIRTRSPIDKTEVVRLHNEGMTDMEISKEMHCTRANITHCLNKLGYYGRKSKKDNIELRNKISNSLIGRYTGEKNPNYKGYKDEKQIARGLFKTISKRMIRNSGYRCAACGVTGGNLETHHIKPFSVIMSEFFESTYDGDINTIYEQLESYPDFIDETNMVVLCERCHHEVHYSDNHELSPFRWESATTIETGIHQK